MLRFQNFIIMKRFISFFLVLFAGCLLTTSCENEDFGVTAKHSYTVTSELGDIGANSLELRFYEYNDNDEMINYQIWKGVQNNQTRTFDAHDLATKLVVYVSADTSYGEFNRYVAQVFYLSSKNTKIHLNGGTLVQKYNPIE